MKKIVVIGSINMDVSLRVPHIPQIGETILAKEMNKSGGGKGANQALTIAKLGGMVSLISRVGNDDAGRSLYRELEAAGINLEGVVIDKMQLTGTASIYVSDTGDNNIVVYPGANFAIDKEQIDRFRYIITEADYCVMQLEIPMDVIEYVAEICAEEGVCCILNPAPAKKLSEELIKKALFLIPNETELQILTGFNEKPEKLAQRLLAIGASNVIVTLGSIGSMLINDKDIDIFPCIKVEVADTTAAGDSYIGGFVVALSEGKTIAEAIKFATCVAGITVTRRGAYTSIPSRQEVNDRLRQIRDEKISVK